MERDRDDWRKKALDVENHPVVEALKRERDHFRTAYNRGLEEHAAAGAEKVLASRGRSGYFNPELAPVGAGINAAELNMLRDQLEDARKVAAAAEEKAAHYHHLLKVETGLKWTAPRRLVLAEDRIRKARKAAATLGTIRWQYFLDGAGEMISLSDTGSEQLFTVKGTSIAGPWVLTRRLTNPGWAIIRPFPQRDLLESDYDYLTYKDAAKAAEENLQYLVREYSRPFENA